MIMNNKLTVKDLINVGVFSALYLVLFCVTSFIGYVPILMVIVPVLCAVVVGIPFMLFLSKTHAFGMVTIMSIIFGVFEVLMGRPWPVLLITVGAGVVTDLLLKIKDYKSIKWVLLVQEYSAYGWRECLFQCSLVIVNLFLSQFVQVMEMPMQIYCIR